MIELLPIGTSLILKDPSLSVETSFDPIITLAPIRGNFESASTTTPRTVCVKVCENVEILNISIISIKYIFLIIKRI